MPNASNWSHILPGIQREGKPFQRAVTLDEDWIRGGHLPDLALSGESGPGGKISEVADCGEWLLTKTGAAGTCVISDGEPNGVLTMTTGSSDNDSLEMQLNGEAYKLATNKRLIFEVRAKCEDVSLTDFFIGLAATDTAVIDGVTDYIGFFAYSAANPSYGVCKNGSSAIQGSKTASSTTQDGETDAAITTVTLADDTFNVYRFECYGFKAKFFVDGVYITTLNAILDSSGNVQDFPDDVGLTPTLAVQAGSAAAEKLEVDYIICAADRQ